jgi:hypothetical protein
LVFVASHRSLRAREGEKIGAGYTEMPPPRPPEFACQKSASKGAARARQLAALGSIHYNGWLKRSARHPRRRITMRFLLKVNIPVEAGNAAAKAGKLGSIIQSILADAKPEAAYFSDNCGQRTGYLIVDLQDASQIPAFAEPWFLAFNAAIEFHPVMIADDLAKAGSAIEKAVKKYA